MKKYVYQITSKDYLAKVYKTQGLKMIEEYSHIGVGYKPFLIKAGWQVAKLNYHSKNGVENLNYIELHHKTDEAFILLKGTAVLIIVEKEEMELRFNMVTMKECIVYNIPKDVWHNIAMKEDAEILIIENANTHLEDYEIYEMSKDQKKTLKELLFYVIVTFINMLDKIL